MTVISPYTKIADQVITSNVKYGSQSPKGGDRKYKKYSSPGSDEVYIVHDGMDPLVRQLTLQFATLTLKDAFQFAIGHLSGEVEFYPERSDRLHLVPADNVDSIAMAPRRVGDADNPLYYFEKLIVTLEERWQFSGLSDLALCDEDSNPLTDEDGNWVIWEWEGSVSNNLAPTLDTAVNVYNTGHLEAPIVHALSITGNYADANHLTEVDLQALDAGVVAEEIRLCDQFNSGEILTLNRKGEVECSYEDDYSSSTRWTQDATNSGCTLSGGKVAIEATEYYYYKFFGPLPISELKLVSKMTTGAGSPIVQISEDGSNWETAIESADIESGKTWTYYLDALGATDVWVRFYCPSGATMDVYDVDFTIKRYLAKSSIPTLDQDETKQLKIVDASSGSSNSATITAEFRNRYKP